MLRENDLKHLQGLTPFVGMTWVTSDINTLTFFFIGGLVYTGLLPSRDRDFVGLGFAYGPFSDDLYCSQRVQQRMGGLTTGVQDFEMVVEFTYQCKLTPRQILQSDMQYVMQPGGTGKIPDAFVLGVQIAVTCSLNILE